MNEMSNSPVQIEPIHSFSSGRGDRARAHSYYHNELDVQHKGAIMRSQGHYRDERLKDMPIKYYAARLKMKCCSANSRIVMQIVDLMLRGPEVRIM